MNAQQKAPEQSVPAAQTNQEMESSIRLQKASVRRQVLGARADAESSWFTVPWPIEPLGPAASPKLDAAASSPASAAACDSMPQDQLAGLVAEASRREGVDEKLLRAVIERESGFKPCAVSRKGAQGLMQLMPATALELGVRDPFDPKQNIDAGARYLKQLLDKYGNNVELALAAYNAGPARVDEAGKVPPISETRQYILNILSKLSF
jgi:soluble lytic murein transglycosylase-like protein